MQLIEAAVTRRSCIPVLLLSADQLLVVFDLGSSHGHELNLKSSSYILHVSAAPLSLGIV